VLSEAIEVIVEERVPVWSIGLGNPDAAVVERCHRAGILVMAMVCTVDDARAVAASGVDVIVAQGIEAGGHRSTWRKPATAGAASVSTMALVPGIVDAVRQPVVAAGGIVDGRGLAAALTLGAAGVLLGTRFVATKESAAPPRFKQALLAAGSDDTTITDAFSGLYARALRNRFTDEYAASAGPSAPAPDDGGRGRVHGGRAFGRSCVLPDDGGAERGPHRRSAVSRRSRAGDSGASAGDAGPAVARCHVGVHAVAPHAVAPR
jgi:nitronate monooxygenase